MDKCDLVVLNILVTIIPLSFACIYPNIGNIMTYTGAFFGTVSMYFLPVLVHLKKRYTQLTNPLLAEAIALNEFTIMNKQLNSTADTLMCKSLDLSNPPSPKIVISDRIAGAR